MTLRIVTFKIEEPLLERLDQLTRTNESRSEIIRTGIELLLFLLNARNVDDFMYELKNRNPYLFQRIERLMKVK